MQGEQGSESASAVGGPRVPCPSPLGGPSAAPTSGLLWTMSLCTWGALPFDTPLSVLSGAYPEAGSLARVEVSVLSDLWDGPLRAPAGGPRVPLDPPSPPVRVLFCYF